MFHRTIQHLHAEILIKKKKKEVGSTGVPAATAAATAAAGPPPPLPRPSASSRARAARWPWPWLDLASRAAGSVWPGQQGHTSSAGPWGPRDPAPAIASERARARARRGPEASGRLGRQRRRQEAGTPGPFVCVCAQGGGEGWRAAPGRQAPAPSRVGVRRGSPQPSLGRSPARPPPHAPQAALGSYRKGISIPSPPTRRHLALFPSPSWNFLLVPGRALRLSPHSPPQFAHFRPPSAWPCRSAASGVLFFPPLG